MNDAYEYVHGQECEREREYECASQYGYENAILCAHAQGVRMGVGTGMRTAMGVAEPN